MSKPTIPVQFFYDIGSPKSYIQLQLLLRYAPLWNFELELCPSMFGAIFQATGNSPPMVNPYKKNHGAIDMARNFAETGVEGSVPGFFGTPQHNFLAVARFLRVVKQECAPEVLLAATQALFRRCWVDHIPPVTPEFFATLAPSVFNPAQLKDLLAKSVTEDNKAGVKTDAQNLAKNYGAYGFPWTVLHLDEGRKVETFFGADRMESMSFVLGPEYRYLGPHPTRSRL